MQESIQCTDTGTLRVMSKSLQEYKFTSEGMTRGNSGLLRSNQPYKVSCMESDANSNAGLHQLQILAPCCTLWAQHAKGPYVICPDL